VNKKALDDLYTVSQDNEAIDGQEVLRKVDKESQYRDKMRGFWQKAVVALSCILVAYHLITSRFGMPPSFQHRAIHLGFILCLVWMYYPARKGAIKSRPSAIDMFLIILTIGLTVFTYYNIDALALRKGMAITKDYYAGAIYIIMVLEACRRVSGKGLFLLAIIFLIYAYFGPYFPGVLAHRGYSVRRLIYQMYLTTQGIFGLPL